MSSDLGSVNHLLPVEISKQQMENHYWYTFHLRDFQSTFLWFLLFLASRCGFQCQVYYRLWFTFAFRTWALTFIFSCQRLKALSLSSFLYSISNPIIFDGEWYEELLTVIYWIRNNFPIICYLLSFSWLYWDLSSSPYSSLTD